MTLNLLTYVVRQSFFLLICADVYKMNIFHFQKREEKSAAICATQALNSVCTVQLAQCTVHTLPV